ncbi:MAG TPA: isochorismatase family protein, partial [Nitrososphaeraceae archaeon]|nr:isochorismatase family protein [Nitrososphaeraceae archaeon]
INLLIFAGIDTSICVETSLRDGFNLGYDVVLISDATASGKKEHYKTTLERVSDYYGLVMNIDRFKKSMNELDKVRKNEGNLNSMSEAALTSLLEEFNLLDPRTFALSSK